MANSIVGYTHGDNAVKVNYVGKETTSAQTIIDNDPESATYKNIAVNVKISSGAVNNILELDSEGLTANTSTITSEIALLKAAALDKLSGYDKTKKQYLVNDKGTFKWEDIPEGE